MDPTLTDTRPSFSRLTEQRTTKAWKAAVPAVVVIVAFVALLGYLASNLSTASQKVVTADRENQQMREQQQGMATQIGALQRDLAVAKSPGRTTVVLQAANKKAGDSAAWAAVTWGELADGKSWMRVNAYGVGNKPADNKAYHVWLQPASGAPVDLGAIDVDSNGDGFVMKTDLPGIDQGKSVMLTTDAEGAKQPGDVIAKADLPKLQPTMKAAPPASADNAAQPQAKANPTSQQMHQESGK
jgi:hypothetical protein